jgi:hypothetical protein
MEESETFSQIYKIFKQTLASPSSWVSGSSRRELKQKLKKAEKAEKLLRFANVLNRILILKISLLAFSICVVANCSLFQTVENIVV